MRRSQRLSRSSEFNRVRSEGRSWSHPVLVLCTVRNQLSESRAGFLTSKRVGGAVVRNRVRRRMREAVRARYADIAPGWDLVWIARGLAAQASFARITDAVNVLLRRAGCLREQGRQA